MLELNCGDIRPEHVGKEVSLNGWCRYKRDHGGKLFIDIADRYGITQLVFEGKMTDVAGKIGKEYVLRVNGTVEKRDKDTVDESNPTGLVEIFVKGIEVVNESKVPPFEIIEQKKKFLANEELRFRYRFLDLRRREAIARVEFRNGVLRAVREYFWENGFLELETPTLVKDTYETGSKTFLVPSRMQPGKFYALDQSPQMYKQLCMISGLDRYFQIARCYRDEDPREDRQPEHTQIDVEVSFKDERWIHGLIEGMVKSVFKKALGKEIKTPFRHMSFAEAMATYGSDKPDLRFGSEIVDVTDAAKESDYNILKRVIAGNGRVKAMAFPAKFGSKGSNIDKNYMLKTIELAKSLGLGGLTWLYVKGGKIVSEPESIAQSLGSNVCDAIMAKLKARDGDLIILCSDTSEPLLLGVMGKLRAHIGRRIGTFKSDYEILWIDGFPLFERDEITGKLKPSHNPFTSPTDDTLKYMDSEPEKVMSRQYDLVINGVEMGSGSIRIRNADMQKKVLSMIGMSDDTAEGTFGFLLEALRYGAPIHGGIGIGLDRFVAVLYKEEDIKEFVLFPKNKRFESFIDGSPTPVDKKRLKEDFYMHLEPPK